MYLILKTIKINYMRHGSLFSGIGGFDLAAEWMGWENVFHCEWNTFGQKVLKHHFPKSISYNDITKTDFSIHRGNIDIITGGFPCQPYSTAGLRKGKADERHLFPEMLRAIKEIQPTWVIGENVRGLVSWGGGMVFHEVCDDLEREGYEVQPFIIPAASVNAPHRRERIWFIAYNASNAFSIRRNEDDRFSDRKTNEFNETRKTRFTSNPISSRLETNNSMRKSEGQVFPTCLFSEAISTKTNNASDTDSINRMEGYAENTNSIRQERGVYERQPENANGEQSSESATRNLRNSAWENFPTQSPLCNGNDGLSTELDGITFSKWRNESVKAGGNAIVPQVAYQIFKTIEKMNNIIINQENN